MPQGVSTRAGGHRLPSWLPRAERRRDRLGNPIRVLNASDATARALRGSAAALPKPAAKAAAAAMAKLTELQQMLQEERKLRKDLEAELEQARR